MDDLTGAASANYQAVLDAVTETERMADGENRLRLIKMLHWGGALTIEGAARAIPCGSATAKRWQRLFFVMVARNRGLID